MKDHGHKTSREDSIVFFKQKTAYEKKEGDWSSDVCSSDLISTQGGPKARPAFFIERCGSRRGNGRASEPRARECHARRERSRARRSRARRCSIRIRGRRRRRCWLAS